MDRKACLFVVLTSIAVGLNGLAACVGDEPSLAGSPTPDGDGGGGKIDFGGGPHATVGGLDASAMMLLNKAGPSRIGEFLRRCVERLHRPRSARRVRSRGDIHARALRAFGSGPPSAALGGSDSYLLVYRP